MSNTITAAEMYLAIMALIAIDELDSARGTKTLNSSLNEVANALCIDSDELLKLISQVNVALYNKLTWDKS